MPVKTGGLVDPEYWTAPIVTELPFDLEAFCREMDEKLASLASQRDVALLDYYRWRMRG